MDTTPKKDAIPSCLLRFHSQLIPIKKSLNECVQRYAWKSRLRQDRCACLLYAVIKQITYGTSTDSIRLSGPPAGTIDYA